MKHQFGIDSGAQKRGTIVPVEWNSKTAVNPHMMICGMSGAGKTVNLRKLIRAMIDTVELDREFRVHVLDFHGDIEIEGASTVMFSQQSNYGFNPLRVNPDPHFGGLVKTIQMFVDTMNAVMRQLGGKQEACLRNLLMDLYREHGFDQLKPETWRVDDQGAKRFGNDPSKLYLAIPKWEKDQAKAVAKVTYDPELFTWWIRPEEYEGAITRWPVKTVGRRHPSIQDALVYAKRLLAQAFMGADEAAVTNLAIFNRASQNYQKKVLDAMKRGGKVEEDDAIFAELEKKKQAAIESYTEYVDSIKHGREIETLMKYDSIDVLKSVIDRLENLDSLGVFKADPPPHDPAAQVWRNKFNALTLPTRKLAGLVQMEGLFMAALQRGEQDDIVDVIVVDEAHIYGDEEGSILDKIAKEGRKFGLALVLSSQSPVDFTDGFLTSCATRVLLGIDDSYYKKTSVKMGVSEDALKWIRLHHSMLVQVKQKGATKNDWKWTLIQNGSSANDGDSASNSLAMAG